MGNHTSIVHIFNIRERINSCRAYESRLNEKVSDANQPIYFLSLILCKNEQLLTWRQIVKNYG